MSHHFVEFSKLTVEYPSKDGPVHALAAIDLAFEDGDFVCIVGPRAAARRPCATLAGFLTPSVGERRSSTAPDPGPGADRGVVFQQPALMPWINVVDNADFGPKVRGMDGGERRGASSS